MVVDYADVKAGDILAGKYRVERVLGRGGMGIVAAATHTELGTRFALKILLPRAGVDDDSVERFAREGRAVSQLRGEHVVRVFDVGKLAGNTPYLVMEHLEGEDFDDLIQRDGPLPTAQAVDYILQACEGIAEAHALGIVHRDVKPGNLFLTRRVDGSALVKVVDFGLAKQQSRKSLVSITAPLVAVGSPEYMSPEQMRALDVDARSDIWSLGICLYQFTTGVTPFDEPTLADIFSSVLTSEPKAPHEVNADVPPGLSAIVLRCLQKQRLDRYSDLGALAAALEEFASPSAAGTAERIRLVLGNASTPSAATSVQAALRGLAPRAANDETGALPSPAPLLPLPSPPSLPASASAQRRRGRARRIVVVALPLVALATAGIFWKARDPHQEDAPTSASAASAASSVAPAADDDPSVIGLHAPRPGLPTAVSSSRARTSGPPSRIAKRQPPAEARVVPSDPPPAPAPPAATEAPAPVLQPAPPPPRFSISAARVEVGSATHAVGTTAMNVNRAIAPLAGAMTGCYRAVLPQATGVLEGTGVLHVETDEEGIITTARSTGPVSAATRCIANTAVGRKVPNVDTGRVSADVPLVFRSQ